MKRLLGVVVLIGIAVIATSCDFPPPAATVGTVAVSQTSLDNDVATWTSAKYQTAAVCLMDVVNSNVASAATEAASLTPQSDPTVSTELTDAVLEYQVELAAQLNELSARHAKVTSTDTANAKADLEAMYQNFVGSQSGATCVQGGYSDPATLLSGSVLPKGFVNEMIDLQAAHEAATQVLVKANFSASGLESYYSSNPADRTAVCLSALGFETQAQAQTIRADIVAGTGGATFASEATQYGATSQAGSLGCPTLGEIADQDSALLDPIQALTGFNQVGQPFVLQQASGPIWLVLEATSQESVPFDALNVRLDILNDTQGTYTAWLSTILSSHNVRLNPRYGNWSALDGVPNLEPPVQPPASVVPNQAADSLQLTDNLSGLASGSTP